MLNIVLIEPQIPPNTGTIGRLCAANDWHLHLVEPLGFSLDDKHLKRSGLDYWPFVKYSLIKNLKTLEAMIVNETYWVFSTKGKEPYTSINYQKNDWLIFGNEPKGFPDGFLDKHSKALHTIPMKNPNIRSLNLANAVSIVSYEATRQLGFE